MWIMLYFVLYFDLTDKTARNADPKGQHGLRYFLSPSFASNGVDYV